MILAIKNLFRKQKSVLMLAVLLVSVASLAWWSLSPKPAYADSASSGWYEHASGFQEALHLHNETGKPMFIYVYAPWCHYCQNFHRQVLSSSELENYLQSFIKVELYPDESQAGKKIANSLGITSYPTILVAYGSSHHLHNISPFIQKNGEWVMDSPTQFIRVIQSGRN